MTSRPPPSAVPWIADTTGFGELSIMSSTECRPGSTGGLPNSVMSAPAMNVRPEQTMTIAWTALIGDRLLDPVVQALAHVLAQRVDRRVVDGEHGHAAAGAQVYGLSDLRHVRLL